MQRRRPRRLRRQYHDAAYSLERRFREALDALVAAAQSEDAVAQVRAPHTVAISVWK